jgi:heme-degrading monooxygenase HmoA
MPGNSPGTFQEKTMRTAIYSLLLTIGAGTAHAATVGEPPSGAGSRSGPVVTIVKVAKPWYAPDFLVVRKMRAALPQYQRIPGLTYKIFSLARPGGEFGGIYLWQDRASAEAWFNPAWYRRVKSERGVDADVRMFDAPRIFDRQSSAVGPDASASIEDAVVTVVTLPTPTGTTREQTLRGFDAEMATERRAPGLLRRYAIITRDGRFGGAYLWRDEAAAKRWFDAAWQRKLRELYGSEPQVEWFDAPILMPSALPANRDAERAMTLGTLR